MNTKTFNENFEIDRKSKGLKATAKHAPAPEMPNTADGEPFDTTLVYFFYDPSTMIVRQSSGLKFEGSHLWAFGLRVVEVAHLRANRDDALADAQKHCNEQIENLRQRIRNYESEKQPENRSLKAVLTAC